MAKEASSRSSRASKRPSVTVPAAARTMALFEVFAREQRELSKSDIARLLDLPESSASDLLNTLYAEGYVTRTVTTRRFYPTGRIQGLARAIATNDPLVAFANEATSRLAQLSGETSAFGIRQGQGLEVLSVTQGSHRLRYVLHAGDTFSLHATALGKALLGGLDEEERGRLIRLKPLAKLTPNTKVNPPELEKDIAASLERGYFSARDEGTVGVSSFAVAGRVADRALALGIIGPTGRFTERGDELRGIVVEVGAAVFSES